jgi:hypothetical protein
MSMSDAEYQRVVEELKNSKAHLPGREYDWLRGMERINACAAVDLIARTANRWNGFSDHAPAYQGVIVRATALASRIRHMSIWHANDDLQTIAHKYAMALGKAETPPPPAAFDRALAEIQATVELAERRPS